MNTELKIVGAAWGAAGLLLARALIGKAVTKPEVVHDAYPYYVTTTTTRYVAVYQSAADAAKAKGLFKVSASIKSIAAYADGNDLIELDAGDCFRKDTIINTQRGLHVGDTVLLTGDRQYHGWLESCTIEPAP